MYVPTYVRARQACTSGSTRRATARARIDSREFVSPTEVRLCSARYITKFAGPRPSVRPSVRPPVRPSARPFDYAKARPTLLISAQYIVDENIKKKRKGNKKRETRRGGRREEKKDGRIPACQQVDKGLKRVHVPAQIFASPHLLHIGARGAFFFDSCLS